MFTPVLTMACLETATSLVITDATGPDTGDGSKWDGVAGIDSSLIHDAEIEVTDPNASAVTTNVKSVINAANPITASFELLSSTGEFPDGYYDMVYDIYLIASNISAIADYSGTVPGTVKITTAAPHVQQTGMYVEITGTTAYDGIYETTYIDASNFYITATYAGSDIGQAYPIHRNEFNLFNYVNAELAIQKMYAIFAEMPEGAEADAYLKDAEKATGLLNALKNILGIASVATINNIHGRITRILDYHSIDLTFT